MRVPRLVGRRFALHGGGGWDPTASPARAALRCGRRHAGHGLPGAGAGPPAEGAGDAGRERGLELPEVLSLSHLGGERRFLESSGQGSSAPPLSVRYGVGRRGRGTSVPRGGRGGAQGRPVRAMAKA